MTLSLMEAVLSSLEVFPCLKDFIILFDCDTEDSGRELYPPPCMHREIGSKEHGFGTLMLRATNLFPNVLPTLRLQNAHMPFHRLKRTRTPISAPRQSNTQFSITGTPWLKPGDETSGLSSVAGMVLGTCGHKFLNIKPIMSKMGPAGLHLSCTYSYSIFIWKNGDRARGGWQTQYGFRFKPNKFKAVLN